MNKMISFLPKAYKGHLKAHLWKKYILEFKFGDLCPTLVIAVFYAILH